MLSFESKIQHMLDQITDEESMIVCSSMEEAQNIYQVLYVLF